MIYEYKVVTVFDRSNEELQRSIEGCACQGWRVQVVPAPTDNPYVTRLLLERPKEEG